MVAPKYDGSAIVKINWTEGKIPKIKLVKDQEFYEIKLERGIKLDYELTDKRRCIGFYSKKGRMKACPEFKEIESGSQCINCRSKDIYRGWAQGNKSPNFEAKYSVYLAQCGSKVKVGVARTERLKIRWLEQGADYAVEIERGLTGDEALQKEKKIAKKGLKERVRKEHKIECSKNKIESYLNSLNIQNVEIRQLRGDSEFKCKKLQRKGLIPSPIKYVKGQIISNGKLGLAVTSGKVLCKSTQKELSDF